MYDWPSQDEIDIEILGRDTTKMQINVWNGGVPVWGDNPPSIDLPSYGVSDAAASFNIYGFNYQPDKIEWFVNRQLVYTLNTNIPTNIGYMYFNFWPTKYSYSWTLPFVYSRPLRMRVAWAKYS